MESLSVELQNLYSGFYLKYIRLKLYVILLCYIVIVIMVEFTPLHFLLFLEGMLEAHVYKFYLVTQGSPFVTFHLQHIGNSSYVIASFQQTLWTMVPVSSGALRQKSLGQLVKL